VGNKTQRTTFAEEDKEDVSDRHSVPPPWDDSSDRRGQENGKTDPKRSSEWGEGVANPHGFCPFVFFFSPNSTVRFFHVSLSFLSANHSTLTVTAAAHGGYSRPGAGNRRRRRRGHDRRTTPRLEVGFRRRKCTVPVFSIKSHRPEQDRGKVGISGCLTALQYRNLSYCASAYRRGALAHNDPQRSPGLRPTVPAGLRRPAGYIRRWDGATLP